MGDFRLCHVHRSGTVTTSHVALVLQERTCAGIFGLFYVWKSRLVHIQSELRHNGGGVWPAGLPVDKLCCGSGWSIADGTDESPILFVFI